MLPTKVDMIRPMVIEAIPAPVRRLSGETPSVCSTARIMTRMAMVPMKNWRIVAAWAPICEVMADFEWRMNSRIVSQKPMIRAILMVCIRKVGRFMGAAMNRSKRRIVLKAKPIRNARIMMNLLTELTMPSN